MPDFFEKYLMSKVRNRQEYSLDPAVINFLMTDLGFEEIKPTIWKKNNVVITLPPAEHGNLYLMFTRITHGVYQCGFENGKRVAGSRGKPIRKFRK